MVPLADEAEMAALIQGLKTKQSADSNCILVMLLKQCYKNLLTPLTKLINLSFENGGFPSVLKIAKVVLIYKKGGAGFDH